MKGLKVCYPSKKRQGFTLIELALIMAIIAILTSFITINLLKPQTTASTAASATTLVSDLKEQQTKAMAGDSEGTATAQAHGIYFEPTHYTLFRGTVFSAGDPANFTINLETGLSLSTTLPQQQIVFTTRSGEVANYTAGADTVTLNHTQSGEQKTITINRYGSIIVN